MARNKQATKQAMKNMGYSQQGHPYAGLSKQALKKKESQAFAQVQQLREQGNTRGVKKAMPQLNKLRHHLTVSLLGGSAGSGFNPGLSVKGQHKATRQLLKAKLGSRFGDFYHTGAGQQHQPTPHQGGLGNVNAGGRPPVPTTGRRIGPPARRRRSGYGGY